VPGGPDQQHAFGHAPAQPAVLLGILQELDDLAQLVLGLVDAGHIVEPNAGVGLDIDLGLALADRHQAAAESLAHAPRQKGPYPDEQDDRNDPGQEVAKECAFHLAGIGHPIFLQLLGELRIDAGGHELRLAARERLLQLALDITVGDTDLGYLALVQQLLELAVGDRLDPLRHRIDVLQHKDAENGSHPVADMKAGLLVHGSLPVADDEGRKLEPPKGPKVADTVRYK
jgi:hypothetical protein